MKSDILISLPLLEEKFFSHAIPDHDHHALENYVYSCLYCTRGGVRLWPLVLQQVQYVSPT